MKISLSGASCGGKSTVVKSLSDKYKTFPDSGMICIKNHLISKSIEDFIKWRKINTKHYYNKIIRHQLALEKKSSKKEINVFDRSVLDYIALMVVEEGLKLESYKKYYSLIDIDHVFIFFPLSSFDDRKDTGRLLNKDQSKKVADISIEICEVNNLNYSIVPLAKESEQLNSIIEIIEK